MSLQKAYLSFIEPKEGGKPGGPTTVNGNSRLEFTFNPKEYTIKRSAEWERKGTAGAKQSSPPEFKSSGPRQLDLEIFLDATDSTQGDVTKDVETLFACVSPLDKAIASDKPKPPFVLFGWGQQVTFTAYVKTVSAKYTLFRPDGVPIRAVCTVNLEEMPNPEAKQNPTSGGLATVRGHTVMTGDSLASIAYQEYGDATMWRAIARANDIDDPLRLRPGTRLLVPQAREAAALG
ncbi:MAG: LysM peptidoglycan-binding domain-containing protein [Streptosporangiales bacterium]|nr:LysM peptidoglycan-binding domain-containing protein [Streptosporangiales bacterium]